MKGPCSTTQSKGAVSPGRQQLARVDCNRRGGREACIIPCRSHACAARAPTGSWQAGGTARLGLDPQKIQALERGALAPGIGERALEPVALHRG